MRRFYIDLKRRHRTYHHFFSCCCDKKQLKGEGVHFSSQFKVHSTMAGTLRQWELNAGSHITPTKSNECKLIPGSLSPFIQSRIPCRGNGLSLNYNGSSHRYAQRLISQVILDPVKLTTNIPPDRFCPSLTPDRRVGAE